LGSSIDSFQGSSTSIGSSSHGCASRTTFIWSISEKLMEFLVTYFAE
jgi:hypothetical protein